MSSDWLHPSFALPPHRPPASRFAEKLRLLCGKLGLTCIELAKLLEVNNVSVFRWASGDRTPGLAYKARIDAAIKSLEQGYSVEVVRELCLKSRRNLRAVEAVLEKSKATAAGPPAAARKPAQKRIGDRNKAGRKSAKHEITDDDLPEGF
ncbi:MAG: hypothetical protein V3T83_15670 [Acidobacteriota bacterium]